MAKNVWQKLLSFFRDFCHKDYNYNFPGQIKITTFLFNPWGKLQDFKEIKTTLYNLFILSKNSDGGHGVQIIKKTDWSTTAI